MLLWSGSMRWKLSHGWHSHRINWPKTGNLRKDHGARITPSAASGTTDSAFLCACLPHPGRRGMPVCHQSTMQAVLQRRADVVVRTLCRSCENYSCASCTFDDLDQTERALRFRCGATSDRPSSCCSARHVKCPESYECIVTCRRSR